MLPTYIIARYARRTCKIRFNFPLRVIRHRSRPILRRIEFAMDVDRDPEKENTAVANGQTIALPTSMIHRSCRVAFFLCKILIGCVEKGYQIKQARESTEIFSVSQVCCCKECRDIGAYRRRYVSQLLAMLISRMASYRQPRCCVDVTMFRKSNPSIP